jgi:hypothetical protein
MTWRDKLALGPKENAVYRKENLPPRQIRGIEVPCAPGRSPEIPQARRDRIHVIELDIHGGDNQLPAVTAQILSVTRDS